MDVGVVRRPRLPKDGGVVATHPWLDLRPVRQEECSRSDEASPRSSPPARRLVGRSPGRGQGAGRSRGGGDSRSSRTRCCSCSWPRMLASSCHRAPAHPSALRRAAAPCTRRAAGRRAAARRETGLLAPREPALLVAQAVEGDLHQVHSRPRARRRCAEDHPVLHVQARDEQQRNGRPDQDARRRSEKRSSTSARTRSSNGI